MNDLTAIEPANADTIRSRILTIRGVQVMLDRDLAELYGVPTKRLNEQVKRNAERFPPTFMFPLSRNEMNELVANCDRFTRMKHSSVPMTAFTEHGIIMLASVLKSGIAIEASIRITNTFVAMRKALASIAPILARIETAERRQITDQARNEERFDTIFKAMDGGDFPPQKVFYEGRHYEAYSFAKKLVRRAIVRNPRVFLLDEPLSNLDAKLRATMRTELTKLHNRVGTTFVYVTHDQVEAMTMATRIVVMKDGLIQQVDTPQHLYDYPVNLFVAGFIGTPQMNFINGTLEKKGEDVYFNFEQESVKLPAEKAQAPELADYIGKEVTVGVRPECLHDDPASLNLHVDSTITANVEVTELMGAEIYLYLKVGEETNLTARVPNHSQSKAGEEVKIALDATRFHIFDVDTERCILH